jgi:hypothetical protein
MVAKVQEARSRRAGKRTYNSRLIKRDYAYFIFELADLFRLHRTLFGVGSSGASHPG